VGAVALLSAAVVFAPASPLSANPLSYDCRGFASVTMAYALGSQMNHVTLGSPRYAEGEPANLIDMSSPMQLYRTM